MQYAIAVKKRIEGKVEKFPRSINASIDKESLHAFGHVFVASFAEKEILISQLS